MATFVAEVTIRVEVEAPDEDEARFKIENLLRKRVTECTFGSRPNDRAAVRRDFEVGDLTPSCPDCGEEGADRGHMGCGNPQDIPDDSVLDDPMTRER